MNELKNSASETRDAMAGAADVLFSYLRDVIYAPQSASLDIGKLPEEFADFGKGLMYLVELISETRALARELSKGNLECPVPPPTNEIASPLKALHSSLTHLSWQTQQVAKGDYSQHVDFMGAFSLAFNNMIDQLKRQREKDLDEKERLEQYVHLILESTTNPLLVFDEKGKLIYISNSWFHYCEHFSEEEAYGKEIQEMFSPVVSEELTKEIRCLYDAAILGKQPLEAEQDIDFGHYETGDHFRVQYTPMVDWAGSVRGVMVFLFDLTESDYARKMAEQGREAAERSSRMKSSFLAKMSHELRTPMNAIIGTAQIQLQNENIPNEYSKAFEMVYDSGSELLGLINEILDMSKIESMDEESAGAEPSEQLRDAAQSGGKRDEQNIIRDPMPYGKVLVVDDVETNLYIAEGFLSLYSLNIESVDSGLKAIEKVENGNVYDVIFMDHMMPILDGMETTQKLREMGYQSAIVALTANALVGDAETFLQNGFDGFMSKPIIAQDLNDVLNEFVRDKHPEEAKKYEPQVVQPPAASHQEMNPKLLKLFVRDAEKAVSALRETIAKDDIKLFATTAHAMKSALANIGEDKASATAASLEKAGHSGDKAFIDANAQGFIDELERLIAHLSPEETEDLPAADVQEDRGLLKEQLLIIHAACEDYDDAAAYEALDLLGGSQWAKDTSDALEKIRDTLYLHSDFSDAAELCLELIEAM